MALLNMSSTRLNYNLIGVRQPSRLDHSLTTLLFLFILTLTCAMANLTVPPPPQLKNSINVPKDRLLMGPGPSNVGERSANASALPVIGHMHPEFFKIMDDVKAGLQYVFQTKNPWTLVLSGPGHAAMECLMVNLLEPGDKVLIGVNGLWGNRAADLAIRLGSKVARLETPTGTAFTLEDIEKGLIEHKPQLLFLVHSESSTGVMQGLEGVGELCRKHNCLLGVDSVASLGGVPFYTDKWGVDAIYTGSQKVIGAPPGIAPISFGPKAVDKIRRRNSPIKSFLLDMNLLTVYWDCNNGEPRTYHHTPPISLIYALREALAVLVDEGLEPLWKRHAEASKRLQKGVEAMGLELFVKDASLRLPTVTTIKVKEGLDWKAVTKHSMDKFNIEIAGGLGETVGKVFRIGVMGVNAQTKAVERTLEALEASIQQQKASM